MAKPPAPSDLADKFMLRMPEGMRERIADAAKDNKRSMNAEIISRLEDSFDYLPRSPSILNPEGLEAMRSYAEQTTRMLRELKDATNQAERVALKIMAERDALAAERNDPLSPHTKGERE